MLRDRPETKVTGGAAGPLLGLRLRREAGQAGCASEGPVATVSSRVSLWGTEPGAGSVGARDPERLPALRPRCLWVRQPEALGLFTLGVLGTPPPHTHTGAPSSLVPLLRRGRASPLKPGVKPEGWSVSLVENANEGRQSTLIIHVPGPAWARDALRLPCGPASGDQVSAVSSPACLARGVPDPVGPGRRRAPASLPESAPPGESHPPRGLREVVEPPVG